jgi:lipid-A-disaccharide synthase-like uncharacterized protein
MAVDLFRAAAPAVLAICTGISLAYFVYKQLIDKWYGQTRTTSKVAKFMYWLGVISCFAIAQGTMQIANELFYVVFNDSYIRGEIIYKGVLLIFSTLLIFGFGYIVGFFLRGEKITEEVNENKISEVSSERLSPTQPVKNANHSNSTSLSEIVSGAIKGFKDGMNEAESTSKAEFFDLNSAGKKPKASIGSNVFMIFFGLMFVGFSLVMLEEKNSGDNPLVFYFLILLGSVISLIYSFVTFQAMRERGWQYWIDVLKGLAFVVAIGVGIVSLYNYLK